MQHERLYRPRPPSWFSQGMIAWYDEASNVVIYDENKFDLRNTRDFRMLRRLDREAPYYLTPTA